VTWQLPGGDVEPITWRRRLVEARATAQDETPVLAVAPDEATLDIEFTAGYGAEKGPAVLVWSERFVYFPVCYDGAQWLGSAPRDPVSQAQPHVGSEPAC